MILLRVLLSACAAPVLGEQLSKAIAVDREGLNAFLSDPELKALANRQRLHTRPRPQLIRTGVSYRAHLKTEGAESVVFLKEHGEPWGSEIVRADEMAYNINQVGEPGSASSMKCLDFCEEPKSANVAVHVKWLCECALSLGVGKHFFDPVDRFCAPGWDELLGNYHILLRGSGSSNEEPLPVTAVLSQTSYMKQALSSRAVTATEVVPHHHSNYQNRRKAARSSNDGLRIGFAGDWPAGDGDPQALQKCLDSKGLRQHQVVTMKDIPCDVNTTVGPSHRGDCFAMKLATLDIGVVWTSEREDSGPALQNKPSQRLVNMLAVGVPAIAHDGFAAHHDVLGADPGYPALAKDVESLCQNVVQLIQDENLRNTASSKALEIAAHYSPEEVANLYLRIFETIQ
eukprot:gb/GFBE01051834.1/.p1 GENE.gb/GFBE01051834.1/~~gb/GFBE01051834.1/.p1  ORF type:complete len:400 (+),score=27.89 gb/GFBE01051834.1/:1-1200(+)